MRNVPSPGFKAPHIVSASLAALAVALAAPASGQEEPPADPVGAGKARADVTGEPTTFTENEILVIASGLRGEVDAPQPAIVELGEEDIASYGAGSLAELVQALSSETGSGRGRGAGRPVFLMNGLRVSSFREMRSFPPEAVQKVEILPEEFAQRYGFAPDQRVINFILKDDFSSREIEVEYGQPQLGGSSSKEAEATYLRIDGPSRLNVNVSAGRTSALTEGERSVVQTTPPAPGEPDPADYRTLIAGTDEYEATANWTRALGDAGASLSVNAAAERTDRLSLSGIDGLYLDSAGEIRALERDTRSDNVAIGSTLNARIADWQIAATIDAGRTWSTSLIDRPDAAGTAFDRSSSVADTASAKVTAIGRPVYLPAGDLSITFDAGYDWDRIDSEDTRSDSGSRLARGEVSGGVNVSVPLASRSDDVWAFLGDLDLNLGAGVNRVSDFGTLADWSAGITWSPAERLNLQATWVARDAAPSLAQLGLPTAVTYNVPVFDFANGETVLAQITSGGNSDLARETQRDLKLGLQYEVPLFDRSNVSVEYFRNRSNDVTSAFPLLTQEIEAAFPGRVTRTDGTLVAIDQRPITLAEQRSSRIRTGINFSGRIGSSGDRGSRTAADAERPPNRAATTGGEGPDNEARGPDPDRFARMRQLFCAPGAAEPDIASLPEAFQQRLRREDGTIDPQRLAEARQRLCSDDASGAPPGPPDPARLARLQQAFCVDGAPRPDPDLAILPDRFRQRLMGPDGATPDPERLKQLQDRICAVDTGASGARDAAGPGRGPERGQTQAVAGPAARFMPGSRGRGGGRWNLSFNHTYELANEVLVAEGGPTLDLLGGDALSDGGTARHAFDAQGGVFYEGLGLRVRGTYKGKSRIDGSGLPGSTDLYFGDLYTLDLRMFADLGRRVRLVAKMPFLAGTRVSLDIDNLFDARQRVTDASGTVPLSYQPFLLDPVGRRIEVELRKLF